MDKDTPIESEANRNSCCFSIDYENNIVSKRRRRYIMYIYSATTTKIIELTFVDSNITC